MTVQTEIAKPTASTVFVDAETAARWLTRNQRNRNVRPSIVANYAADMLAGRWAFAADPIRFDVDGRLVDGQHRLTAVVRAKTVTVPFLVVRNLDPESQFYMDAGIQRSAGDQLSMKGVKDPNVVASAANFVVRYDAGKATSSAGMVSKSETLAWVENNPGIYTSSRIARGATYVDAPVAIMAAAHFIFARQDQEAADSFFDSLTTRAGLVEGSPILALDNRLRAAKRLGQRVERHEFLGYFIRAWNAYRDGRLVSKIQAPRGGSWNAGNFPVAR